MCKCTHEHLQLLRFFIRKITMIPSLLYCTMTRFKKGHVALPVDRVEIQRIVIMRFHFVNDRWLLEHFIQLKHVMVSDKSVKKSFG